MLLLGVVLCVSAGGARALDTIPWTEAGAHLGRRVTVDGTVAATRRLGQSCLLEFAPHEPGALVVHVLIPVFSDLPPHPEVFYRDKHVKVTGIVRRGPRGVLEMVVRGAGQITVIEPPTALLDEVAAESGGAPPDDPLAEETAAPTPAPAPAATPSAPPAPQPPAPQPAPPDAAPGGGLAERPSDAAAPPPAALPPAVASPVAAPEPGTTTAANVTGPAVPAPPQVPAAVTTPVPAPPPSAARPAPAPSALERLAEARVARCASARTRWQQLRPRVRAALVAMARCVAGDAYRCRDETDGLYAAMARLDEVQAEIDASCW